MNVDAVIQMGIERDSKTYRRTLGGSHPGKNNRRVSHSTVSQNHTATHKTVGTAQAPWNPGHVVRADLQLLLRERG